MNPLRSTVCTAYDPYDKPITARVVVEACDPADYAYRVEVEEDALSASYPEADVVSVEHVYG